MDLIALILAIAAAVVFLFVAYEGKRLVSLATGLLLLDVALIAQFTHLANDVITAH